MWQRFFVFTSTTNNNNTFFYRKLGSEFDYDLRRWRRSLTSAKGGMRKEYADGFAVLDADGGAGWDLLCALMQFQPEARLTAAKALQHPWLQRDALNAMGVLRSVAAQVGLVFVC